MAVGETAAARWLAKWGDPLIQVDPVEAPGVGGRVLVSREPLVRVLAHRHVTREGALDALGTCDRFPLL